MCHLLEKLLIGPYATCIPFQSGLLLSCNMADCFKPQDVEKLLAGKHVVFLGDSVTRAIYKVGKVDWTKHGWIELISQDFVWLANDSSLIPTEQLKITHLPTFPNIEATRYLKNNISNDIKVFRCELPFKASIQSKFPKGNRDRRVSLKIKKCLFKTSK